MSRQISEASHGSGNHFTAIVSPMHVSSRVSSSNSNDLSAGLGEVQPMQNQMDLNDQLNAMNAQINAMQTNLSSVEAESVQGQKINVNTQLLPPPVANMKFSAAAAKSPIEQYYNHTDYQQFSPQPQQQFHQYPLISLERELGLKFNYQSSFPSPPDSPFPTSASSAPIHLGKLQGLHFNDWVQPNVYNNMNINIQPKARAMSLPHIQFSGLGNGMGSFPMYDAKLRKYSQPHNQQSIETPFKCPHPGCNRSFQRIQNLKSHSRCHLTHTPHKCGQCGLGFKRTTDLQRHFRTIHTKESDKPWGCDGCDRRFGRSDALKRHKASKSRDHGCAGRMGKSHGGEV